MVVNGSGSGRGRGQSARHVPSAAMYTRDDSAERLCAAASAGSTRSATRSSSPDRTMARIQLTPTAVHAWVSASSAGLPLP